MVRVCVLQFLTSLQFEHTPHPTLLMPIPYNNSPGLYTPVSPMLQSSFVLGNFAFWSQKELSLASLRLASLA